MTNDEFIYPLTFLPVYQDYLWGGQKLEQHFNRSVPGPVIAESWEVTDRPDGMSVVDQGAAEGQSLRSLIETLGDKLLGTAVPTETFPLLIKILDAHQVLSVQVHPNDETAATFGDEAKTEMWYVLEAEPDAKVYCGLVPGTSREAFVQAIEDKSLEDLLTTLPIKKGDAIFVPGGRIHAIAAGCLLLEVQQNSNTTYRIYDWGRTGADGKPRELHLEQSLEVIQWQDDESALLTPRPPENGIEEIILCPYFCMQRITLSEKQTFQNDGQSFHAIFAPAQAISINEISLEKGRTALLPAALSTYTLAPESNEAATELIRIFVPA